MGEGKRSCSAPTGISHLRGERNLALAEMSVDIKTVS